MPELFEFPPTRSNRAKWALEELGVKYTSRVVDFMAGAALLHDVGERACRCSPSLTRHNSSPAFPAASSC